jgi:hypothetical protein
MVPGIRKAVRLESLTYIAGPDSQGYNDARPGRLHSHAKEKAIHCRSSMLEFSAMSSVSGDFETWRGGGFPTAENWRTWTP